MLKPSSTVAEGTLSRVTKTVTEVADEIRRYLAAHANASDTMEGVQNWWLPFRVPGSTVQRALDALVAEGVLQKRQLPDGNLIYGARPRWSDEAANS